VYQQRTGTWGRVYLVMLLREAQRRLPGHVLPAAACFVGRALLCGSCPRQRHHASGLLHHTPLQALLLDGGVCPVLQAIVLDTLMCVCVRVCVRVRVRVRVRARAHARARVCVCACVRVLTLVLQPVRAALPRAAPSGVVHLCVCPAAAAASPAARYVCGVACARVLAYVACLCGLLVGVVALADFEARGV
jgi:hypothetical protein